ncbi:MAG: sensor histidine kinase [Solirubrobacteraceae bacterium]
MQAAIWTRTPRLWADWKLDSVLAALFVLVAVPATAVIPVHGAHVRHPDALAYAMVVLAALGIAGHRRWSWPALGAALAAAWINSARSYPGGPVFLPVIVVLYTIAKSETRERSLVAGVVAVVGQVVVLSLFHRGGSSTDVLTAPLPVAAVLFLGWAVGSRRAQIEEEGRRRVDAERLRIARELHDVVAHSIATINVRAGVAVLVIELDPEQAAEALRAIKAASKDALREMRGILGLLRQGDEEEARAPAPGLDQLNLLISSTSAAGLTTSVEVSGRSRPLPALVDLAAYRIVQESLTNAVRYAGPASARVSLIYHNDRLVIDVVDDGRGGSNGAGADRGQGSGLGIPGMRERAAAVGGELDAGPRPEGGFRVHATLPVVTEA